MAGTCVFCGSSGPMTGEHVFGDWLNRIGLDVQKARTVAGPLNRIGRDLGVSARFNQTVRDVCADCNNGWMSDLESVAKRVLTPFVLGQPAEVDEGDRGAIAAWVQKTALVAMLVSSSEDRASGYGLPTSEYHALYRLQKVAEPLPDSQVWIGRYSGDGRRAATWVAPLVVAIDHAREPERTQGYATTISLGHLVLQAVRFTTPALALEVTTRRALPQLWPPGQAMSVASTPRVDDHGWLSFSGAREFLTAEPHVRLVPWKAATELAESKAVGPMVELPTICGKHTVYYPATLVDQARRGRYYAFPSLCECDIAYLIETESDGAHCKASGSAESIIQMYEEMVGEEFVITNEGGRFVCRALTSASEVAG
ncbi:MAG: hypothetical protein WAL04_15110 [Acidimicrobiales bacterium]